MENKRILYPADNNQINVVIPAPGFDVVFVAKKDVPKGLPYLIVDAGSLPKNAEERKSWQVDFSNPDGFGGEQQ